LSLQEEVLQLAVILKFILSLPQELSLSLALVIPLDQVQLMLLSSLEAVVLTMLQDLKDLLAEAVVVALLIEQVHLLLQQDIL
jgi:hypothetical protein